MNKLFKLLVKWTDIKVLKTDTCKYCGEEFPITDLEIKILDKQWFKYPEHCSTCNFKLLNSLLNDKHLYHRKDSKTWEKIISIHSEWFLWKVYDAKNYKKLILDDFGLNVWKNLSDDIFWDFKKLYKEFPRPSRLVYPSSENADYSSHVWWSKNVYLSYCVFADCEDIYGITLKSVE